MDIKVTSLEELKEFAQGEIVELPGFVTGKNFVVRLKRPGVLGLVKSGKIPNELLSVANSLFNDGTDEVASDATGESFGKLCEVMDVFVRESLIYPSLEQLAELNLDLTDDQKIAILEYCQSGVKELKPSDM